jgi:outer membrane protein assembly factor BamA
MRKSIILTIIFSMSLSILPLDFDKSFLIIPMAFYTPETSLALGASFIHFQKPFPENPELSNLNFGIAYFTLKKQFVMNLSTERYLKTKDLKTKIELGVFKFPDDFYGIGANTSANSVEAYTPFEIKFKGEVKKRIYQEYFAGIGYRSQYMNVLRKQEKGLLAAENVLGNEKSFVSAFGLLFDCNRTNDNFFPTKGYRFDLSTYFFRSFFGSNFNFDKISFQYSHFYPFLKKHVIAYQIIADNTFGDVPFSALPKLGGSSMMRGFAEGRYIDKKYLAMQTELRIQVYKRLGMVLFGAFGEVAESYKDFQTDFIRFGYGLGLRFRLREVEKLNFRVDFAFSKEDFKFYVAVREVF